MKGLITYAKPDFSQDRSDYLDEKYFRLLARKFRKAHPHADIHLEEFEEDNSDEFLADLQKPSYTNLDLFVYIGHGGRNRLYSADWGEQDITPALIATRLKAACKDGAVIIFYACNVGRLNNSFLQTLYSLTIGKHFRLYGHNSSGRAGNNPDKTVFPPSNGAMVIDVCLGDLANAPKFRRAWRAAIGNEADDLWATFFTLTNDELLHRSCRSVIDRAVRVNRIYKQRLGWQSKFMEITRLLGLAMPTEQAFAAAIARWQYRHFGGTNDVDGILGRNSWRLMQAELGPTLRP